MCFATRISQGMQQSLPSWCTLMSKLLQTHQAGFASSAMCFDVCLTPSAFYTKKNSRLSKSKSQRFWPTKNSFSADEDLCFSLFFGGRAFGRIVSALLFYRPGHSSRGKGKGSALQVLRGIHQTATVSGTKIHNLSFLKETKEVARC